LSIGSYGNSSMKFSSEVDSDGAGAVKGRTQLEQSAAFQQQVSA